MNRIKSIFDGITLNQKRYVIIMLICTIVNFVMSQLMVWFNSPINLDIAGTIAATIILEPAAGLLVGLADNFIRAIFFEGPAALVYYSISAVVALLARIMLNKDERLTFKRIVLSAALIIVASTILSVILGYWQFGRVSNVYRKSYFSQLALNHGFGTLTSSVFGTFMLTIPSVIISSVLALLIYKLTPPKFRGKK